MTRFAPRAAVAGHVARKRFGQNFLTDTGVLARIVDAIAPEPGDRVVEIGPGLGALTRRLLDRVRQLDAIEIDRDLAARLANEFPPERLRLHIGDALVFDFAALGPRLRVVGNLPYNISSPLLFRLAEHAPSIADVHVMLQREVVDRMAAAPGEAAYGRLTVMLGYRFSVKRIARVPAAAFRPRPSVESALVRLVPHAPLPVPARDEKVFAAVVAAAFGQRRKTLRNALARLIAPDAIAALGIDPGARGETLSVAQFVALADAVPASPEAR